MTPRFFILSLVVLVTLALGLTAFNLRVAFKDVPTVSGAPLAQCTTADITAKPLGGGAKFASSTDANILVTPAITIQANSLALLWVTQSNSLGGLPGVRDPNRSWQLVGSSGPNLRKLHVFRSLSPTATTGAVTIISPKPTIDIGDANVLLWSMVQHTNVSLSGINGAGAIGQVVSAGSEPGSPLITSIVMPLGPAQSGRSAVTVGVMAGGSALPFIPGEGFTFVSNAVSLPGLASQVEFRPRFSRIALRTFFFTPHGNGPPRLGMKWKSASKSNGAMGTMLAPRR